MCRSGKCTTNGWNDTQVVPYKVFAFYANTSINRDLMQSRKNLNRRKEQGRSIYCGTGKKMYPIRDICMIF